MSASLVPLKCHNLTLCLAPLEPESLLVRILVPPYLVLSHSWSLTLTIASSEHWGVACTGLCPRVPPWPQELLGFSRSGQRLLSALHKVTTTSF